MIRCMLLCMLEAMESELCLLDVPEVMGCVQVLHRLREVLWFRNFPCGSFLVTVRYNLATARLLGLLQAETFSLRKIPFALARRRRPPRQQMSSSSSHLQSYHSSGEAMMERS